MSDLNRRALFGRRTLLVLLALLALALSTGCDKLKQLQKAAKKAEQLNNALQGPVLLTGSDTGNYYTAGNELNEVLDDKLTVKTSSGSYGNLMELGQGKAQYAIVQFDTLIMFLRMGGENAQWANNSLGVAPLSNEMVHVLVRKGAKIKKLEDLKGKRLAASSERSGSFVSAFTLMAFVNDMNLQRYENTQRDPYEKSLEKLQNDQLDALFITTSPGMPLLTALPASAKDKIELLDIDPKIKLPKQIEFVYGTEKLPKGTYAWQEKDVTQLTVPAYLFARFDFDQAKVKTLAEKLYTSNDKLTKSGLFKLATVKTARDHIEHSGVGFHPGAKDYITTAK